MSAAHSSLNRDAMKAMLRLDRSDIAVVGDEFLDKPAAVPAEDAIPATALKLLDWDLTKGHFIYGRSPEFQELGCLGADASAAADAVADLYNLGFLADPLVNKKCIDSDRLAFVKRLLDMTETRSLRESTRFRPLSSEIAALRFAHQFSEYLREKQKELDKPKPPAPHKPAKPESEQDEDKDTPEDEQDEQQDGDEGEDGIKDDLTPKEADNDADDKDDVQEEDETGAAGDDGEQDADETDEEDKEDDAAGDQEGDDSDRTDGFPGGQPTGPEDGDGEESDESADDAAGDPTGESGDEGDAEDGDSGAGGTETDQDGDGAGDSDDGSHRQGSADSDTEDASEQDGDEDAAGTEDEEEDPRLGRACRQAVQDATEAVEELEAIQQACGAGPGCPPPPGANNPEIQLRLFERVQRSPMLREILEAAGRLIRLASAKQRTKPVIGADEMVGVTLGDDIARLVGSELAMLGHPILRTEAMLRIVTKQAMCRKHQNKEKAGRGPIISCIDESGSMYGDKLQTAKALALSIAYIAARQRRWCCLLAYTGRARGHRGHLVGMSSEYHRMLVLKPGSWDQEAVLDWLEGCLGGGSDCDVPVGELPQIYSDIQAPPGKTDVIFVTDAIAYPTDAEIKSYNEWKMRAKVKTVALVVDPDSPKSLGRKAKSGSIDKSWASRIAGAIAQVADEVYACPVINTDSEAVNQVLSL
jgi:uncharacterized protein with von Willebrand factor type A (vWA) domain